jgi:chromosome partitioning protein
MAYVISVTQTKGGATKTTSSVNILGALLELGKKTLLCDMDKDKPDAIYWADLGNTLNNYVIPLNDENPKPKLDNLRNEYELVYNYRYSSKYASSCS